MLLSELRPVCTALKEKPVCLRRYGEICALWRCVRGFNTLFQLQAHAYTVAYGQYGSHKPGIGA